MSNMMFLSQKHGKKLKNFLWKFSLIIAAFVNREKDKLPARKYVVEDITALGFIQAAVVVESYKVLIAIVVQKANVRDDFCSIVDFILQFI